jgi:DNA primase
VIVEGYTDVMACHLAGVTTAVATSGTSFGEGHIAILRRLIMDDRQLWGEVIFTFDGDAAGRRAALRAFSMEEKFKTQTFIAVQPDGMDPCDLRGKEGDAAVRELVASRVPLYEFAVRSSMSDFDLDSAEGRVAALDAAAKIVAAIKDVALRKVYAAKVDRWIGLMDESLVLARIAEYIPAGSGRSGPGAGRSGSGRSGGDQNGRSVPSQRTGGGPGGPAGPAGSATGTRRPEPVAYDPHDPVINLERQVLKLAIQRPALLGPAFDGLGTEAFTASAHQAVRELIAGCGGVAGAGPVRDWVDVLLGAAPHDNARMFLTRLAVEPVEAPGVNAEPDVRYADELLSRVEELAVSRRIVAVKSRLQRMNPLTEQVEYNRLFGDLVALEQRRKLLLERSGGA